MHGPWPGLQCGSSRLCNSFAASSPAACPPACPYLAPPQKKGDQYSAARLTDDDKAEIRALARDPRIGACCTSGPLCMRCCCGAPRWSVIAVHCLHAGALPCPDVLDSDHSLTPDCTRQCRCRRRAHRQVDCALHLRPPEHQAGHRAGAVWRVRAWAAHCHVAACLGQATACMVVVAGCQQWPAGQVADTLPVRPPLLTLPTHPVTWSAAKRSTLRPRTGCVATSTCCCWATLVPPSRRCGGCGLRCRMRMLRHEAVTCGSVASLQPSSSA